MASNKTNRTEVPEAKAALDRFKTEVASELGVNLKEGYNGDLTSKEAGSIGGEMVRRRRADELTCVKQNLSEQIRRPTVEMQLGVVWYTGKYSWAMKNIEKTQKVQFAPAVGR